MLQGDENNFCQSGIAINSQSNLCAPFKLEHNADNIAFIHGNQEWKRGQFSCLGTRIATGLHEAGVRAGRIRRILGTCGSGTPPLPHGRQPWRRALPICAGVATVVVLAITGTLGFRRSEASVATRIVCPNAVMRGSMSPRSSTATKAAT